jgi:hypothetical protein
MFLNMLDIAERRALLLLESMIGPDGMVGDRKEAVLASSPAFRGRHVVPILMAVSALLWATASQAREDDARGGWPREIQVGEAVITLYQPQLDSWEGNAVECRAAVSVEMTPDAAPVFGAVWLSARFETDRSARMVTFTDIRVPSVRFPQASQGQRQKLAEILEGEMTTWNLEISLDRLVPTLDLADHTERSAAGLDNDPPKIIVRSEPAVLIVIEGPPDLQDMEGSDLQRVANTPYVIVKSQGDFYLATNRSWFTARDILGPWKIASSSLPGPVQQIDAELEQQRREGLAGQREKLEDYSTDTTDPRIPEIVVSTEPAELIVVDGNPEMAPLPGHKILYVGNTNSDVLFEAASQDYYVLLSGRWYRSKDILKGPWEFVPNDELAAWFSEIPADSEVGHLRTHVAGTDEAREAVLEQSIPQTAAVIRSDTSFAVEYDGEPVFEAIEGTGMSYAANTASSVILVDGGYWACDQAIWYTASSPDGPWTVAAEIPAEISTIPPSSPVFNVTYVDIYESTPEVVHVGYTPGYTGSYVSNGCVVYGTGWRYLPWSGDSFFARPATWGFHARWDRWWGWSFGTSYSNGPVIFTLGFAGWGPDGGWGGWWGPARYRPHARAGFRADSGRSGSSLRPVIPNNIYARPGNRDRVVQTFDRTDPSRRPGLSNDRANNIYTDHNGDVYRRNDDGSWERHDGGGWSKVDGVPSAGYRSGPVDGGQPSTAPQGEQPILSGGNLEAHEPLLLPPGGSQPSARRPSQPPTQPSSSGQSGQSGPVGQPYYGASTLNYDYIARTNGGQRVEHYNQGRSSGGGGR